MITFPRWTFPALPTAPSGWRQLTMQPQPTLSSQRATASRCLRQAHGQASPRVPRCDDLQNGCAANSLCFRIGPVFPPKPFPCVSKMSESGKHEKHIAQLTMRQSSSRTVLVRSTATEIDYACQATEENCDYSEVATHIQPFTST